MLDRQRLIRELGDASAERHVLCRAALHRINQLRLAIVAVQAGEEGSADALDELCGHVAYEGAVWTIQLDALIAAERTRSDVEAQLEQMDDAECHAEY